MNNNYHALASRLQCREQLVDLISKNKDREWLAEGYGFDLMRIPAGLIQDDFYLQLSKEFTTKTWILRSSARTYFHWHKDTGRKVAINVDLISDHAHTVFYGRHDKYQNIYDLDEIKYEKDVPYLLNANNLHMILNTGEVSYTLSIGILLVDYHKVRDFIISNNL